MNNLNLSPSAIDRMILDLRRLAAEEDVNFDETVYLRGAAVYAENILRRRERAEKPVAQTVPGVGC